MSAARLLPWSWIALGVAGIVFGVLLFVGTYASASFRTGLDSDLNPMLAQATLLDFLAIVGVSALICMVLLVISRWIANRARRPAAVFLALMPGIPGLLFIVSKAWFIVGAALEPPSAVVPFEQDTILYLPNLVDLLTLTGSFLAAAVTFRTIAGASAAQTRT